MRWFVLCICLAGIPLVAQNSGGVFRLDTVAGLKAVNVKMDAVEFRGRKAVHVVAPEDGPGMVMVVPAGGFRDGTLELEVAGQPAGGAMQGARGFIGAAFRVQTDSRHYECFYVRPTNGRADDQVRRNHSTQYTSEPDYPWDRLRKESPGAYESYVDLEPGVWTKMRIVVSGKRAQLYVGGAAQSCLIVNDLKGNGSEGGVALWVGVGTDGYFSNLRVGK